ncbi:hypothetical protein CAPTEDRAFT_191210 [Capitella teleta]|uniref:Uncharacterized protein n=1 Tax=Capitella teleta TaxID=283909 RepID=R7TFT6_CAPTE|nr:hypothetical protein CAPTEDRAFT_191210 [Capitella teleta]|eukprot:ELT92332.1 hypothetical protein CAPTEDRAFT_191210 [Capitella teleta]
MAEKLLIFAAIQANLEIIKSVTHKKPTQLSPLLTQLKGQGSIPLVPNQPKTETRTSVINWRRYESNCALGDTGQQGICARDARVLYSEVFAKLFRLFDPAAVFVVDDDWTSELPGILSIYHFSCEESYLVLPERLDNYHSGNGEYINILIRCYLEDSQRLILQISKSSSLRQRYVNWILLGQSARCLDNPGSFVERPGDNVLTFDAAGRAPSVRHVNGSDALLASSSEASLAEWRGQNWN